MIVTTSYLVGEDKLRLNSLNSKTQKKDYLKVEFQKCNYRETSKKLLTTWMQ